MKRKYSFYFQLKEERGWPGIWELIKKCLWGLSEGSWTEGKQADGPFVAEVAVYQRTQPRSLLSLGWENQYQFAPDIHISYRFIPWVFPEGEQKGKK